MSWAKKKGTPKKGVLGWRPCAGAVIFNAHGNILVGERLNYKGAWQCPQGGVDRGESLVEAALRETYEEMGIARERLRLVGTVERENMTYESPPRTRII